jgi:microcystin-dependent protein
LPKNIDFGSYSLRVLKFSLFNFDLTRRFWMKSLCLAILMFTASFAHAAPTPHKGIAVQAYILTPTQAPASGSGLTITSQILTPGDCVLIEEQFSGVSVSNGYLRLNVGTGTRTAADKGLSLAEALDNVKGRLNLDGPTGPALCSYTPTSQDARKVRVSFTLGADAITANFALRSTGYAVASDDAQALQGKSASEFLQPNISKSATQTMFENFFAAIVGAPGKAIQYNGSNFVAVSDAVSAANISGTIPDASIVSIPYSKLTGVPAALDQITKLTCSNGQILKSTGSAFVCATPAVGNAGTVTSITAGTNGLTGGTIVSSGTIDVDFTKVVSKADLKYLSALQPTTTASGDLSGTFSAPSVSKIQGIAVSAGAPVPGQVLKYSGSGYSASNINLSDMRASASAGGGPAFPSVSCGTGQAITYQSATDSLVCADLAINGIRADQTADLMGTTFYTAKSSCPANSLPADGSPVSRSTYAGLYSTISTTFGTGDGTNTFNVPDLRGVFIRGSGSQTIAGNIYSGTLGLKQADQMQGHKHQDSVAYAGSGSTAAITQGVYAAVGPANDISSPVTDGVNGTPRTGTETRPANIGMTPCIWTVSTPAPVVSGSVISPSPVSERLTRATVNNIIGNQAVVKQGGSWISPAGCSSAGQCKYAITAGTFSDLPACVCSANIGAALYCSVQVSGDSLLVWTSVNNSTYANEGGVSVICVGQR